MIKRARSRARTLQHQISAWCWTLYSSMALPAVSLTLFSFLCCVPSPEAKTRFPFLTGYGGSCLNGTCQSGSLLDTAKVTPRFSFFFSLRDLRRSLTDLRASPRAREKYHAGLVCGKLTDLSSDYGRCGPVYYHRNLGYYQ
jgi:hypothetical protein